MGVGKVVESLLSLQDPTDPRNKSQSQRPIIVDSDALESPDTVTLRYEEEAAVRANGGGGDLRGGSSPDLLPMAAYKPHPPQMHGILPRVLDEIASPMTPAHTTSNNANQLAHVHRVFRIFIQPVQPAKPTTSAPASAKRKCRRTDESDGLRSQ